MYEANVRPPLPWHFALIRRMSPSAIVNAWSRSESSPSNHAEWMSSVTPAQPHLVAGKRIDDLYSIGRIESQSKKDHDTPPATGIRGNLRQGQTYSVKNHTTWDGLVLYEIRKASRAG